ncbi:MAG TPA: orotidine-5'-phosphate decarboxylase [Gaiellaceae bacterium]|nr:orotidine-5'-phosphate decarboxylase [Gaiellaceae bacterium]
MAQEAHATTGPAGSASAVTAFADRLVEAVGRKRSQLVVGLDPVSERLPPELRGEARPDRGQAAVACEGFCRGIVDAVAPFAVAVKPQSAFFEALGPSGVAAYAAVCDHARAAGLLVIADAKRGDIGSTARAYAAAFVEPRAGGVPLADAVTVNPYMGRDSVEPFLDACREHGGGLFCLVKTSNPGGAEVQDLVLADGRRLWQQVAALVNAWGTELVGEHGLSAVGAVVGATYPREVAEARRLLPRSVLLLPGVGAQGASPADLEPAFAAGPASALVAASRSVIYAHEQGGGDWRGAAAAEAERLAREIWAVSGW